MVTSTTKILETRPTVAVCGVGYVGVHLVETFAKAFRVVAFDISEARCETLRRQFKGQANIHVTSDPSHMAGFDLCCISVPTLLLRDKTGIDASYVAKAVKTVSKYAKQGSTIVMESSVTVGMTRKYMGHLRQEGVFVGFSPERVDPGRTFPVCDEIPKIISGIDDESVRMVGAFYMEVFQTVVPVSTMETAEMCKLYENCFRMINIAYVNEISDECAKHGIDPHEMIDASATKPFGFMPFRPGLGVGGHCIPVNPWYLFTNNDLPLLQQATLASAERPARKARELFDEYQPKRVLVIGMAFKPGQSVISYSPQEMFVRELQNIGVEVFFYDPLVEQSQIPYCTKLSSADFQESFIEDEFDVVAVTMPQHKVDFTVLDGLYKTEVKWYCCPVTPAKIDEQVTASA
ncbi:hypothetical protein SpCBS45565_g03840 [Spizellomyces sp. 'palustris']|nr:hypothetical protein SpCBS45565_g03840 [Spizellomyces sp. 'palustris']